MEGSWPHLQTIVDYIMTILLYTHALTWSAEKSATEARLVDMKSKVNLPCKYLQFLATAGLFHFPSIFTLNI